MPAEEILKIYEIVFKKLNETTTQIYEEFFNYFENTYLPKALSYHTGKKTINMKHHFGLFIADLSAACYD